MPRKRVNRSPPIDKRSDDADDDDFFFDDTQSNSGKFLSRFIEHIFIPQKGLFTKKRKLKITIKVIKFKLTKYTRPTPLHCRTDARMQAAFETELRREAILWANKETALQWQ